MFAPGANRGEAFFADAGDVDTATRPADVDDDTQVFVGATRYNGAGYDVRMEVHGSLGTVAVGLDEATPGAQRRGRCHLAGRNRLSPFHPALRDRVRGRARRLLRGRRRRAPSPCTGADALAALLIADAAELSKDEGRVVLMSEVGA